MKFTALIDFIKDTLKGLYEITTFMFDFVNFSRSFLSVLPSEIVGVMISLFILSVTVIIYKTIKG